MDYRNSCEGLSIRALIKFKKTLQNTCELVEQKQLQNMEFKYNITESN